MCCALRLLVCVCVPVYLRVYSLLPLCVFDLRTYVLPAALHCVTVAFVPVAVTATILTANPLYVHCVCVRAEG